MKQAQQQQARNLFIQSDLSKTKIAENLNVDRRTIYQWSIDGDWEKLKNSAKCMPSLLAEKCYYLISHLTDHLLHADVAYQTVTKSDVDMIYKLTKTVTMLKKGSTVNENMETFTWFLEGLHKRDANLAEALIPYADAFISSRTGTDPSEFTLAGHDARGFKPFPEQAITEKWRDEQDAAAIIKEMEQAAATPPVTEQTIDPATTDTNPTPAPSVANQSDDTTTNNRDNKTEHIATLTSEQKDAIRRANYQLLLQQKRLKKEQLNSKK
jgi:hypothetical protein